MRDAFGSLLAAPRAPDVPPRSRWDWLLAVGLALFGLALGFPGRSGSWAPAAAVLGAALPLLLPWRRSHPLGAVLCAFALVNATWLVTLSVTDAWSWPAIPVLVSLMLTYTLMRWGSGREMAAGVMAILVSAILAGAVLDSGRSPVQWSFALAFTLLPAAIGLTMRFRAEAVRGEIRDARMAERQRLARELHDTVAHHVSAIAVQAQAARAVFATRPDAAADALRVIEQEASSTLDDMREIVGVLRDGTDAETVPQRGLRDIERLALESDAGPAVEVRLSGELGDLSPSVEAGLYRLVQESVTNARKHAHQARQILITIAGTPDRILLTVDDDGEPATRRGSGFGLVGMEERAELLGGRFTAGPGTARGWHVQVDLPRRIGRTA